MDSLAIPHLLTQLEIRGHTLYRETEMDAWTLRSETNHVFISQNVVLS